MRMKKIFITAAIRNLKKDKLHLFLNIGGLALGLAAFLFIAAYVFNELSFDRFNSKADRIYRMVAFVKIGDNENNFPKSEVPMAAAVLNDLPEVEEAARLACRKDILVSNNDTRLIEEEIWYADASIFNIFDYELILGDKAGVLKDPYSVVITRNTALKYFGDADPIGKSLEIGENKELYRITGILDDIPFNSHLQFTILASFNSLDIAKSPERYWGDFTRAYTYLLLRKGTDINSFRDKFTSFSRKYVGLMMQKNLGQTLTEFEKDGSFLKYELQALNKIHLNNIFPEELKNHGNSRTVLIFGLTGLFILIIACFNFINLSTAKGALRVKEIGIKKVIGSSRKEIIAQEFTETFLLSLTALLISVTIVLLSIPLINDFIGIEFTYKHLLNRFTLLTIVIIPIAITVLAGTYPAFHITRFNPQEAIKGKVTAGKSRSTFRGALVTIQFMLFIILIFSSITIRNQLHLMQSKDPGFNKEDVIVIKDMSRLGRSMTSYKEELLKNQVITDASFASKLPSVDDGITNLFCDKGKTDRILMARLYVDEDFDETLDIQMIDGRFFRGDKASEIRNAVINEQAAKLLGWSKSEGKVLYDFDNGGQEFNVIGIIRDFHLRSMKEFPSPVVIRMTDQEDYLALRFNEGQVREVINLAKSEWSEFDSETPFDYFLLNENYNAQYKKEEQLSKLIGLFTIIAIFIACMGLFGLVSFISAQKKKEISLRKVNGAEIHQILIMLNKDFIKWGIIAFITAFPIAWFVMHGWLQKFAYKTELTGWLFFLSGILAIVVALITVSWQSWKAATRNPVEALRYE